MDLSLVMLSGAFLSAGHGFATQGLHPMLHTSMAQRMDPAWVGQAAWRCFQEILFGDLQF